MLARQYFAGGSLAGKDSTDASSTSSHRRGGSRMVSGPAGLTGSGSFALAVRFGLASILVSGFSETL
jgi:hypothetical protein